MTISDLKQAIDLRQAGEEMYRLIAELYPLCRSITGEGVRQTLRHLQREIPLDMHEVPSGQPVFDWIVPLEWNIRDAWIKDVRGRKLIDFNHSNLHVLGYSVPVQARLLGRELKPHLFSLPDYPDWIPYRTSYYKQNWGFCLSHRQLQQIKDDEEYDVGIDSSLLGGSLTYGEFFLPGELPNEVLISCHICHPSLCNDNLSGIALSTLLVRSLMPLSLRYSYRFLFIPGTIGSITWLAQNQAGAERIQHGLVVVCVGDPGKLTYKKSRRGDAEIDRAVLHVLRHSGDAFEVVDFYPYGYDERQYCSPGFNLAVGSLSRSPHGRFPEYHTSADNLAFVRPEFLADSFSKYVSVLFVLENNRTFCNQLPYCEPQLGKRGLYGDIGGNAAGKSRELAMLWVLNQSDGTNSLLDIAERSGMEFGLIREAAELLVAQQLLKQATK